jgi:apolipoprotein N-acyltransferase
MLDNILKKLFLTLLGSAFLILSFPKFNVSFLAFISFIPIFYVIKKSSLMETLIYGFLFAFLFIFGSLEWLYYAGNYARLTTNMKISIGFFIILYFTFPFILFFFILWFFYRLKFTFMHILILSSMWVSLEFLFTTLLIQFPWILLGYSQYNNPYIIQISEITGVYGISFLIVFINFLLFKMIFSEKGRGTTFLVISILLILLFFYDYLRIKNFSSSETIKVAIVQEKFPQDSEWWNPSGFKNAMGNFENFSIKARELGAKIVIWPEGSIPFSLQFGGELKEILFMILKNIGVPVLFGGIEFNRESNNFFNTAFLLYNGKIIGKYRKQKPAPLGEYLPNSLFPLKNYLLHISSIDRGEISNSLGIEGLSFGVYICGEAIFPNLVRNFPRNGAEFLVNITNDSVLEKHKGFEQHFMHSIFRAVENRRWVIRCSTIGISGFVSPTGRIISKTILFEKTFMIEDIELIKEKTFYSKYGDIFSWICSGFFFISMIFMIFLKKKNYAKIK